MQNTKSQKSVLLPCLLVALLLCLLAVTFAPQNTGAAPRLEAASSQSLPQSGEDSDVSGENVSIAERAAPMAAPPQTGGGGQSFVMLLISVCALGLGTVIFAVRRCLPRKEEAEG
jgi:hypothetical protein